MVSTTVNPTTVTKWSADATLGKIQCKRFNEAFSKYNFDAKTVTEITDHGTHDVTLMFGGTPHPEAAPRMQAIMERYQGTVTAKNYQDIIKDIQLASGEIARTRPVRDTRITPQERAKREQQQLERDLKAKAESERVAGMQGEITGPAVESNVGQNVGAVTVTENEERDGVELRFPDKPAAAVLDRLKTNGWRWTRFGKCWYTKRTPASLAFAHAISGELS